MDHIVFQVRLQPVCLSLLGSPFTSHSAGGSQRHPLDAESHHLEVGVLPVWWWEATPTPKDWYRVVWDTLGA